MERTLGQKLLAAQRRVALDDREVCGLFINQVHLDAIPVEVEALSDAFRKVLESYLGAMGIGSPSWEDAFLVHGVFHIPNQSAEEFAALHEGVAKKNRVTAEALWRYFQTRNTE